MESTMRYPVGIQSFQDIINSGYTYVDKTEYIVRLVKKTKYYFLSRPRRFGKSLFLSTLAAYFEGKRELFKGLAIDSADVEWTSRPVIKISFASLDAKSETDLTDYVSSILREHEEIFNISGKEDGLSRKFEMLIKKACEKSGKKVAVLIDEYDAPLLNTLDNDTLNNSYRQTLKSLFSVLKDADEYVHFAFVTGISRFSHTSLFSGANNLSDISLRDDYAAICGITEEELKSRFAPGIEELGKKLKVSSKEMLSILKENYDGYHFSGESPDIYNPFSLLSSLDAKKIDNYWFESGTPEAFLKGLKRDDFFLPDLDCMETVASSLSGRESYMKNPVALLYEAGYITIKAYDMETNSYTLGLPNKEVATSFSEVLMPIYSDMEAYGCGTTLVRMRRALVNGDADKFMRHLQTFLEGNPYSNTELAKRETYFKNNIYLVLKALGFMPHNEEETCHSRMDLLLRTRRFIYIFELKTDGSAQKAMRQIEEKGYALPYVNEGKTIIRIAANYSSKDNNIDSWQIA